MMETWGRSPLMGTVEPAVLVRKSDELVHLLLPLPIKRAPMNRDEALGLTAYAAHLTPHFISQCSSPKSLRGPTGDEVFHAEIGGLLLEKVSHRSRLKAGNEMLLVCLEFRVEHLKLAPQKVRLRF